MLHIHLATLALTAAALAASGCGSSSNQTTSGSSAPTSSATTAATTTAQTPPPATVKVATGQPLSHTVWIAKGDAICARLNRQLSTTSAKSIPELARVLPQAAAYQRAELAQLAKLVPPSAAAGDWQQFLAGTEQWSEQTVKLAEEAQNGTFNLGSPLVRESAHVHATIATIAKHDGFRDCSVV